MNACLGGRPCKHHVQSISISQVATPSQSWHDITIKSLEAHSNVIRLLTAHPGFTKGRTQRARQFPFGGEPRTEPVSGSAQLVRSSLPIYSGIVLHGEQNHSSLQRYIASLSTLWGSVMNAIPSLTFASRVKIAEDHGAGPMCSVKQNFLP